MPEHDGHRQRILDKLDSGSLREHELLEILLFNAIPRRNTNEIAHRLLSAFGSIRGIFSATMQELEQVGGVGRSVSGYLRCIGKFYEVYYEKTDERLFPETFDPETFSKFLSGKYAGLNKEVLDFYFLDENYRVTFCKRFTSGSSRQVAVDPDHLTGLLISGNKPYGIVAVHNHLNGSFFPSAADDDATHQFQLICSIHNVRFCDHFIYSPNGVYSYYRAGKMQRISKNFSIGSILSGKGG